jgi:polar amino acid transport system substrate-binding protein
MFLACIICCQTAHGANGGKTDSIYPEDIAKIKKRGKLIVAQFGGERPGFFAYDDAKASPADSFYDYNGRRLVGFDIDLGKLLAARLGVELEIDRNYDSFNKVAEGVARGKADIAISKLSVTAGRAQFLRYTQPYISLRMGVLINRIAESSIRIKSKDPLAACRVAGVSIGVLARSSFVEHGKTIFPEAEIAGYEGQEALFKAVESGEVLAMLYDEFEIGKAMRVNPELPIYCRSVFFPRRKDDIAMAVPPRSASLLAYANLMIESENINPTVTGILEDYVPEKELETAHKIKKLDLSNPIIYLGILATVALFGLWLALAWPRGAENASTDSDAKDQP